MLAWQAAKLGEQAVSDLTFFERERAARQFGRRGPRLDEATKAGIGAAIGSLIILAFMLLVLHTLPVGIG
jgi:hypothetical protein